MSPILKKTSPEGISPFQGLFLSPVGLTMAVHWEGGASSAMGVLPQALVPASSCAEEIPGQLSGEGLGGKL